MSKLRRTLWIALALSALLSGCAGGGAEPLIESPPAPAAQSEAAAESEAPAPKIVFQGTDLEGNTVTSDICSQSKLTMINVWATYCNPCLSEMPSLGELAAEYDPEEFQIIGVVSDVMEGEDQALAESLIQQTGANYPHLLLNQSIYYAFLTNATGVPITFFLDQEGRALGYVSGALEKSVWEEIIHELLADL